MTIQNAAKKPMVFRCPICKKNVQRGSKDFPFCSARCCTHDLGQWASDDYCIAGEPATLPGDTEGY